MVMVDRSGPRYSGTMWYDQAVEKSKNSWNNIYNQIRSAVMSQLNTSSRAKPGEEQAAIEMRLFGTSRGGGVMEELAQSLNSGADTVKMCAGLKGKSHPQAEKPDTHWLIGRQIIILHKQTGMICYVRLI